MRTHTHRMPLLSGLTRYCYISPAYCSVLFYVSFDCCVLCSFYFVTHWPYLFMHLSLLRPVRTVLGTFVPYQPLTVVSKRFWATLGTLSFYSASFYQGHVWLYMASWWQPHPNSMWPSSVWLILWVWTKSKQKLTLSNSFHFNRCTASCLLSILNNCCNSSYMFA